MAGETIKARDGLKKKSYCQTHKDFSSLSVSVADKEEFKRTRITRAAVLALRTGAKRADVLKMIQEDIKGLKGEAYTIKLQEKEVVDILTRYADFLEEEGETDAIYAYIDSFPFGGEAILSTPDFFRTYTRKYKVEETGEEKELPVVEVIQVTTGKQQFTSKEGKGREYNSIFHCLPSLGLLLWGKEQLGGKEGIVRVIFDALKTPADRNADYSAPFRVANTELSGCLQDNRVWYEVCFNDAGNIVTGDSAWRSETYPSPLRSRFYRDELLYGNFENSLRLYNAGISGCKGTSACEDCEFNALCNYAENPKPKTEVAVKKEATGLDLTPEQAKVVAFREGVCVVDAGAGSGKSQSVTMRIVEMLEEGTKPEDILLLSFSNAAVKVLRERVVNMVKLAELEADASKIKIATFNSVGDDIIKEYWSMLGFTEEPTLIDDIENYDIILKAIDWENPIKGLDYKNPNMSFAAVKGVGKTLEKWFADIRANKLSRDKDRFLYDPEADEAIWDTYERYVALLKEANYIDYSDQSNLVEKLIEEDEFLISDRYPVEHIIVDEFQDSNDFQMLFIRCLVMNPKFKSLMVVGDDAQAIYGFRGTSPENIVNFEEKIGLPASDLYLSVNHRSLAPVVELGNKVMKKYGDGCIPKEMSSSRKEVGKEPTLHGFNKPAEEPAFIASEIAKLVKAGERVEDIAVIGFKKSFLKNVAKELAALGVPYNYDMKEDMLKNSRVLAAIALATYIREKGKALAEFMTYINELYGNSLLDIGVEETRRIMNKEETQFIMLWSGAGRVTLSEPEKKKHLLALLSAIADSEDAVYNAFLEKIKSKDKYTVYELVDYIVKFKTYNSQEGAEKKGKYDAVSLVTAHSSKGKEWKNCFVSLSDFDSTGRKAAHSVAEGWRLVYVAITRARDNLTITSLRHVGKDGDSYIINRYYGGMCNLISDSEPVKIAS